MYLLVFGAALVGGTLLTYSFDYRSSLPPRLCYGAFLGFCPLGLVCLALASFFGLTSYTVAASSLITLAPLALLGRKFVREKLAADVRGALAAGKEIVLLRDFRALGCLLGYALLIPFFWRFFRFAVEERPDGIFTGVDNNYFDLPVHLGIIYGFLDGNNYPPIHPEFAGARLTYPFLIDFLAAVLMRAGMSLSGAIFSQNMLFALAMIGVLHRWVWVMTRSGLVVVLSVGLILFNGGWGWWLFAGQVWREGLGALPGLLAALPHNYSVLWGEDSWGQVLRFGNSLTTLFLPQRSFLLGLPLFLIISILWWQAAGDEGEESSRVNDTRKAFRLMIAAGAIAGLMPLAHAHSFLVVMGAGVCLALLFRRWLVWGVFFGVALGLALPQIWWITSGSAMQAESFLGWHWGWMKGDENILLFWFRNSGIFIPLLLAAIGLGAHYDGFISRKLWYFYLPFVGCFVGPNVLKLAPWVFDNIKVLFYWYVASVPLVALLLAHLLRRPSFAARAFAGILLLLLTFAGALDVWRVLSGAQDWQLYDRDGLALAALIRDHTAPQALVLNAPIHNHPVLLTGRRSTLGYPRTIWTHGIAVEERESQVGAVYRGEPAAAEILNRLGVDYIFVGPAERDFYPDLNEKFIRQYPLVGVVGDSGLYRVAGRQIPPP